MCLHMIVHRVLILLGILTDRTDEESFGIFFVRVGHLFEESYGNDFKFTKLRVMAVADYEATSGAKLRVMAVADYEATSRAKLRVKAVTDYEATSGAKLRPTTFSNNVNCALPRNNPPA